MLIRGMGRTVGWVVATDRGEVRFRDCQGLLLGLEGGRVEAASGRCPGASRPVEVVGAVTRTDPVLRVLVVEEAPGRRHAFYVDPGRPDAPALADLRPGQIVRVTGPTVGRATAIGPP